MTDRLEEIKARLAALPSEPEWGDNVDASIDDVGVRARNYVARAYPRTHEIDHKEGHIAAEAAQADADFIASAPADMRYLLDEVERLQNLVDTQLLVITEISPVMTEQAIKSAMKDLDSRLAGLINERLSPPQ